MPYDKTAQQTNKQTKHSRYKNALHANKLKTHQKKNRRSFPPPPSISLRPRALLKCLINGQRLRHAFSLTPPPQRAPPSPLLKTCKTHISGLAISACVVNTTCSPARCRTGHVDGNARYIYTTQGGKGARMQKKSSCVFVSNRGRSSVRIPYCICKNSRCGSKRAVLYCIPHLPLPLC